MTETMNDKKKVCVRSVSLLIYTLNKTSLEKIWNKNWIDIAVQRKLLNIFKILQNLIFLYLPFLCDKGDMILHVGENSRLNKIEEWYIIIRKR